MERQNTNSNLLQFTNTSSLPPLSSSQRDQGFQASGYNSNTSANSSAIYQRSQYSSLNSSPRQYQFLPTSQQQHKGQAGDHPTVGSNDSPQFNSENSSPLNLEMKGQPKAIHLIYVDQETKQFKVSDEAKEFLSSIKERVGVISVAGKYRTGKSFLLNRVIINQKNMGFGVGPTINPCTKGLWLWGDTLETEYHGEKLKILLIDSEGIGAFDEDDNHDSKIFLLALLLSSFFIYNSMGTIDENAINSLSLIINLSKELQIKSEVVAGESDPDEIAKYFPSFLWVVRDFSLRLLDNYGNQITSKEYFENAIQQQKGTSDQIETKNRIRRLIKHFFKDRDCYTMVRPVEEERELQSLQTMADDQLRTEFVQQVNYLRAKIYKKVKPKTLNSKYITGEMLLELCYAYTTAINTGSVPNIQNAWSYVCQNECQRAIQESINSYENSMRKVLQNAKEKCDEQLIKSEHRPSRDLSVNIFKQKAVGQDVQDFESVLREGISKKYKDIKQEFLRSCRQRALDYLDGDVQRLKRNLQNDMYEDIDKFVLDIDALKTKYMEQGPRFNGKVEVFQEIQIQLLQKASDFLTISSKNETNQNVTRLKDRVQELEALRLSEKDDFRHDRDRLQLKLSEIESKYNDTLRNEKIFEQRLKQTIEEKDKLEKQIQEKHKTQIDQNEEKIRNYEQKIRSLENMQRTKEEEYLNKFNQADKLYALLEQKLQLTEKELSELKAKLAFKDRDYKEINKELYQVKKENTTLQNKLQRLEDDKESEIKAVKLEHESEIQELQRQINQGVTGNPQVSEDLQQQWNKERQQLNDQLKTLSDGLTAQKQFQEHLMKMLSLQNSDVKKVEGTPEKYRKKLDKQKDKNKELMSMNQNLSEQNIQMQVKQQQLELLIGQMKQFKFMIHHAIAIQCKSCNKLYPKNQYSQHIPACTKENERLSALNAQMNMSPTLLTFMQCQQRENDSHYQIQVEKNFQTWKVSKSLMQIKQFYDDLYKQFPSYSHIVPFIQNDWLNNQQPSNFYSNDLKKMLQMSLSDLASIPFIRENTIFKTFFEFQKYYNEESDQSNDLRKTILQHQSSFSMGITGQSARQSILNPFSMANSNQKAQNTTDGRRSVISPLTHQLQINDSQNKPSRASQLPTYPQNQNMIQELIEDEDYSSMASVNRVSQLMHATEGVSNRVSLQSVQRHQSSQNSREPTVVEYVPKYQELNDEDSGVPMVEEFPNIDDPNSSYGKTQKVNNINIESFTELTKTKSNPPFPMPILDDYETLSQDLDGAILTTRRMSSQLENPMLLEGSLVDTADDFTHTRTNLIRKFEEESMEQPKLNVQVHQLQIPSSQKYSSESSNASSARKQQNTNSRYEGVSKGGDDFIDEK